MKKNKDELEMLEKVDDDSVTIADFSGVAKSTEALDPEVEKQLEELAGDIDSVKATDADNQEIISEEIVKENTEVAAQYSLSALAKVIMAIFAAVVIALISLIAYNSQVINRKMIKIKDLESKREQLLDQQEEIQSRIAMAQSEESILHWAQSQGMVQIAN